jgi:hypothetical protein
MEKQGWIITAIGGVVVIALCVLVNIMFGPCAPPKVKTTLSQINNVYIQWQEEIQAIELQDKSDVAQAEIDSLQDIHKQVGGYNPVECMFPVYFELSDGMDARIDGYQKILEKSQLVPSSETIVQIDELTSEINNLFLNADLHLETFKVMITDFEN